MLDSFTIDRAKWGPVRTRGRAAFIREYGLMRCGVPGALGFALIKYGDYHVLQWTMLLDWRFWIGYGLLSYVLIGPPCGYAMGRIFWWLFELGYKNAE